jgi:guanylate kinase
MNEHGILAVVSGFSGAGKGTLMKALLERYDNYALSISATTRNPREGEVDGREYFFVNEEHFKNMIKQEDLIEYAQYVNHYYGTPKQYVFNQMEQGKDVILEIEIQGALKVKERFPETILIFVIPPNAEELKRRLIGRGTENEEVISARLHRAVEEAEGIDSYDYIVINDTVESCVEVMHRLIQVQHNRVSNNKAFISQIREELKNI